MITQTDLIQTEKMDDGDAWTIQDIKMEFRTNPKLRMVLNRILTLKISYVSELAIEIQESRDTTQMYINRLMNMELLVRLRASDNYVSPLLKQNMARFWARGIKGLPAFQKRYWFTLALQDQGGKWTLAEMQDFLGVV